MSNILTTVLEEIHTSVGQGGILEQIDKLCRRQQRLTLFQILEKVEDADYKKYPVIIYKHIPQNGKKQPALLRFSLPFWKGHDEIFWQALGDYVILVIHRVKDLNFDKSLGRMKMTYFPKIKGRIKYPQDIGVIIQKIAYLVDSEVLPTDFTRFRRMTERHGSLAEMSKEQAALIGVALKVIGI